MVGTPTDKARRRRSVPSARRNPLVGRPGQNVPVHTDPPDLAYPEIRTLASSVVYTDNWIRLRRDDIERRDGSRGTYAVVERGDFALIVPAENGGFYLVEEYRYPVGRRSWSFPQGGFPHGETGTPEELARMELAQETGLRTGRLTHLGSLTAAHGMSNQSCDYFLATELVAGPPDPEPEEAGIRSEWVTREEFEAMVRDARITDDSTLAAYALLLIAERRGEIVIP
jgi:8-oxo-dGTP pyrophosphatase MutT (NUDIX family)